MADDLVDAVSKSVARSPSYVNQIMPVVQVLVDRMRDFGYSDETIHAILVDEKAKP